MTQKEQEQLTDDGGGPKKKSRNTGKKDQEMPLMMFTQSPMHGGLKHDTVA